MTFGVHENSTVLRLEAAARPVQENDAWTQDGLHVRHRQLQPAVIERLLTGKIGYLEEL